MLCKVQGYYCWIQQARVSPPSPRHPTRPVYALRDVKESIFTLPSWRLLIQVQGAGKCRFPFFCQALNQGDFLNTQLQKISSFILRPTIVFTMFCKPEPSLKCRGDKTCSHLKGLFTCLERIFFLGCSP